MVRVAIVIILGILGFVVSARDVYNNDDLKQHTESRFHYRKVDSN